MSSVPRGKGSQSRGEMDYQESDVSMLVKDAVREAHASSRLRAPLSPSSIKTNPRTPTGLVIATGQEQAPPTPYSLDMYSPSASEINHMDHLLAPTYDTNNGSSINGSSIGTCSLNLASDDMDIIRKVEMEIATARKAATDAQARLADALSKSWELQHKLSSMSDNNHGALDDLDIPLRDMLSLDSAEGSPVGGALPALAEQAVSKMDLNEPVNDKEEKFNEESVPQEDVEALKNVESVVSSNDEGSQTANTDPTDSPTGSSSNGSEIIPYARTQQTFESGVELPLEDVEATLAAEAALANIKVDAALTPTDDEADHVDAEQNSTDLVDEYSEYTEETVSDGEEDDNSEYTEETLVSDEVEGQVVDSVPEPPSLSRDTSADDTNPASPKPWIVGSRDMHKSPKEAKPWWAGGWWPDEHGKKKKVTQSDAKAVEKVMESEDPLKGPNVKSCRDAWSTASKGDPTKNDNKGVKESDESGGGNDHAKHEPTIDSTNGVLRDLAVNSDDNCPRQDSEGPKDKKKDGGTRVEFRHPYPVPPQVPKPRPAPDIIADNTTGIPKRTTKWSKPKSELNDLLAAAKGDSLHRRSNAVGALKILLSRDAKNKVILVRTSGFLEALVFVCNEDIHASPEMDTALIARCRAVHTIMKVSEPKENRVVVVSEPGLPECLVKVIKEDTGEARAHACAALAMLAKTPTNKEYLVKVEDLISVLALVVNGTIDPKMGPAQEESDNISEKAGALGSSSFPFEDDATDSTSAASSDREKTSIVPNLYSSDSIRKQKHEKKGEFELQAKINACAALMHFSKHCSISVSYLVFISIFLGCIPFSNPTDIFATTEHAGSKSNIYGQHHGSFSRV